MEGNEEKQNLLDESWNVLFKIGLHVWSALREHAKKVLEEIDEYYNIVMLKAPEFHFEYDKIWKQHRADELSSNYFLATLHLYFIYKIFNERLGGYTNKVKKLTQRITKYTSKIPKKIISNFEEHYYCFPEEFEKGKNDIQFIISHYFLFINHSSYYKVTRTENFSILENYCKYSSKKQILYKKINDAIIYNENANIWLNTLSFSAHIHHYNTFIPTEKYRFFYDINETNVRNRVYSLEKNVLSLAEQILGCEKIEHFDNYAWMSSRRESSDPFEKKNKKLLNSLLSLDNHILEKWPCISFLLYKAIGKMPYHKCKEFFTENAPLSEKKDDSVMDFGIHLQEFNNYSSTELKGEWAQTRIQKIMFFAIADFSSNKEAIKTALDNGTWSSPETQKILLNEILSKNKIPSIKSSFDISQWNNEAFSPTETALNLLYNTIHYNESKFSSGIIQQINFVDEQRSRLFHYQDVKPTDRPIEKDKPKSNADKPRYFNQFCQQSRDNLEKEIETMSEIDCGFQLPMQAHILPIYSQKTFVRQQKCKLFLETDTACNLPQEDFYRNRYMNMLHTRYIYPARNMLTHYSKYNPTEKLLDEQNFDNLILLEYDIKTRLQKEQQLRLLKEDLDDYSISSHYSNSIFVCLKNPYGLKEILSMIIKSPEYRGNLKEDDIRRIEGIESSKEILDILYEVQKNYPKNDENGEKLSDFIQYIRTHHRDTYCLIKDIISQKEYSGNLNNHLLEEMTHSRHPALHTYQFYYTLCDIRRDYHANDALAKELDEKIECYKKSAIIIPKENTEQLLRLFKEIEVFFVNNKNAYVEIINDAFAQNDFQKANDCLTFLLDYLIGIGMDRQEVYITLWNVYFGFFKELREPQVKTISQENIEIALKTLEYVFVQLAETPLTQKLKKYINSNDLKGARASFDTILMAYNEFSRVTKLTLPESAEFIRSQFILYDLKIIEETANQIKEILNSDSFKVPAGELAIYDSSKLHEFVEQRNFSGFILSEEQMKQDIDKRILFRYKEDGYFEDSLFAENDNPAKKIKHICNNRIDALQKCIRKRQTDCLNKLISDIECRDLPCIQVDLSHSQCYEEYLSYLEKIDNESKDAQNDETRILIKKIHVKVAEIRKEFAKPYHGDSIGVFKEEKIYKSFLIEESIDFLLNTIKYCTRSPKVRGELGNKTLLNNNGRLGLTRNEDLSKDIFYPELFKKKLRIFLNTIFGVDNICSIPEEKVLAECDNISCRNITEKNIHFFDQYSSLIILYLIRVTIEFAQIKKIEI